jgi:hypothetical protein
VSEEEIKSRLLRRSTLQGDCRVWLGQLPPERIFKDQMGGQRLIVQEGICMMVKHLYIR